MPFFTTIFLFKRQAYKVVQRFMDKATPMTDNDEASPMKRWRLCTVTS
ncbi:hypothetical protein HN51_056407 [Arachis hypogaea]